MVQQQVVEKSEKLAAELAQIRKLIDDIELLRAKSLKAERFEETEELEKGSGELRLREREIINKAGESIAVKIRADGESLEALIIKLKARIEKMGRLPKRLDKISKVILKISDVLDF